MPQFSSASIDQVVEACRRKCEGIAESFNRCFGTSFSVRVGESETWGARPELHGQPGLLVTFRIGDCGAVVAIPATIPLPDWYSKPDDSERARLDTLPTDWSLSLFPDEFSVDQYGCRNVEDLSAAVTGCLSTTDGTVLPIYLDSNPAETTTGGTTGASLLLIWPMVSLDFGPKPTETAATPTEQVRSFSEHTSSRTTPRDDAVRIEQARRTRQILKLKVPVIVKLAEKRIQLGQLLALGPGAIVTFEKSCEDLLDLCVNNQVYCRGEAVKIGEKFGLKVNEVAPTPIVSELTDD